MLSFVKFKFVELFVFSLSWKVMSYKNRHSASRCAC